MPDGVSPRGEDRSSPRDKQWLRWEGDEFLRGYVLLEWEWWLSLLPMSFGGTGLDGIHFRFEMLMPWDDM